MLLYGAGGHAKVVISCLTASGIPVAGIFDDDPSNNCISNISVISGYSKTFLETEAIIVAVGDNKLRKAIVDKVNHKFGLAIHPSTIIDTSVMVSEGTVIMHGSIIQADVILGKHVIINTRASIDHDCQIGDFVHLAPGATLCGNVKIGENTFIGAGTVVVPNISIGSNCFIAAGSVVTENIPDRTTARGNPARIIRTK